MPHHAPPPPLELPDVPRPELGSRASFPQLQYRSYLAHSAISPSSSGTSASLSAFSECVARLGAGSFPVYQAQRERLRKGLGRLLDVQPDSIALTPGTTRGIADVALALPLEAGDSIATFAGEFPGNVTPWRLAAERLDARVRLLPAPDLDSVDPADGILESAEQALAAGTRFLAVSAVQFQTGYRMPTPALGEACRRHGADLLVDGIQGCGVVPMRPADEGAVAFFCGAHKWMLGVEGAGFAYLEQSFVDKLRPITAGWLSHEDGEQFLFQGEGHLRYDRPLKRSPLVFEGSTANAAGFAALEAGVDMIAAIGPETIFEHLQAYHDELEPRLVDQGFVSLRRPRREERSGIVAFRAPADAKVPELSARLRDKGVFISIPDGVVRIAPHFANSLSEVPFVADAFATALAEVRARV